MNREFIKDIELLNFVDKLSLKLNEKNIEYKIGFVYKNMFKDDPYYCNIDECDIIITPKDHQFLNMNIKEIIIKINIKDDITLYFLTLDKYIYSKSYIDKYGEILIEDKMIEFIINNIS